jgi:hypothetical protein
MECLACQDVTASPAQAPEPTPARPRKLAVGFQFDNLRQAEKPRRLPLRAAVVVPPYSRIVYRAGTVTVR